MNPMKYSDMWMNGSKLSDNNKLNVNSDNNNVLIGKHIIYDSKKERLQVH